MDSMEEKIGAILNNPQMMQQLMAMAQSFSSQQPAESAKPAANAQDSSPAPEFDLSMLKQLAGISKIGNIDPQQTALLKALRPYLSNQRIYKLEKAMRAAKMAQIATLALGQKG